MPLPELQPASELRCYGAQVSAIQCIGDAPPSHIHLPRSYSRREHCIGRNEYWCGSGSGRNLKAA